MSGFDFPAPRVPDPAAAPRLRWGIAGPGWIGERFAESLARHGSQRVTAVGSRSLPRAEAFAGPRGLRAHGSYGGLAADPEVDVVYVATPHAAHLEVALEAIEAGKHVLVEKPIGINAAQAEQLADAATARGVFAAEALWTAFLPSCDVARQLVRGGRLGELTAVVGDYGEYLPPSHRAHESALAGGPLLDLGIYLLALATDILGEPDRVLGLGSPLANGVNGQLSALLGFPGGAQATLTTTMRGFTPALLTVVGTEAALTFDGPFNSPGGLTVRTADGATHRWEGPRGSHVEGLHFQAAAVARAIADGRLEADERPLASSILALRVADELRRQAGIVYPGE
ncbi:Gfo/Idh/MocA family oxidoreductase [Sinomonas sp. JGH33]|uniref:Gfo/Idh/MocA family oxidoreductase n=1 Tax=Sinomonas terricola TaxID=3110330 RepID=A0ABU5T3R7_9MICC|nr:Gfo/Idh/MocA family oxidoreductase [Sinomonas sp. JGH33]MEA5454121.1 Gfo/Idh/MocA family oxidoreductase [Sinomonas sp. JGH33]